MRLLAITAVTFAMLLMAAITYLAVAQDPLGGEPHAVLSVAPPDLAKLHAASDPAPLVPSPLAATSPAEPKSANAIAETQSLPPVAKAGDQANASPAIPLTSTHLQTPPPAVRDPSIEGVSVEILH